MKALITGGAGFIGSHLAEELLNQGNEVRVIDDLSTGRMKNLEGLQHNDRFQVHVASILDEAIMDRLVSECDVVYHLAAAVGVRLIINRPIEVIEKNILGSRIVFNLASMYSKRVLLASSSEIYGKSTRVPFKEDDDRILGPTVQKRWNYSCSKAIGEFLALAYHEERDLDVIIVRLFNTIGPRQVGQYGMVVPRFISQALQHEPITVYGSGNQIRCFTYVSDVVFALMELMNSNGNGGNIFNIGSDEGIRILDLARKIKEMANSESEIRFIPYDKAYEQGFDDMAIRIPDLSRLMEAIQYRPGITLDDSLQRIIARVKEQQSSTENGIQPARSKTIMNSHLRSPI